MKQCNLHIHGEHSPFSGITPMLPLSEPTATGLIIAHGKSPLVHTPKKTLNFP